MHYNFVTVDEFLALEASGNLLESGVYDHNRYGTPKPPRDGPTLISNLPDADTANRQARSRTRQGDARRRQRSLEKAHGRSLDEDDEEEQQPSKDDLGPMPPNWQIAHTQDGHPYFIK